MAQFLRCVFLGLLISVLIRPSLARYENWVDLPSCAKYCLAGTTNAFQTSAPEVPWRTLCPSSSFQLLAKTCIDYDQKDGCAHFSQKVRDDIWAYVTGYFCVEFAGQGSSSAPPTTSQIRTTAQNSLPATTSRATTTPSPATSTKASSTSTTSVPTMSASPSPSPTPTTSTATIPTTKAPPSVLVSTIVVDQTPTTTYSATTGLDAGSDGQEGSVVTVTANSSDISNGASRIFTETDFWFVRMKVTLTILFFYGHYFMLVVMFWG